METPNIFLSWRVKLEAAGYVGLPTVGKACFINRTEYEPGGEVSPQYLDPKRNVGIGARMGVQPSGDRVVAVDVDTDDRDIVAAIHDVLGIQQASLVSKRGAKGFTSFRRVDGQVKTTRFPGIMDVLSDGTYTVIPPSPHPSGCMYVWTSKCTLYNTPPCELTSISPDFVDELRERLSPWLPDCPPPREPATQRQIEHPSRLVEHVLANDVYGDGAPRPNGKPPLARMSAGRNGEIYWLACRLDDLGAAPGDIEHHLMTAAAQAYAGHPLEGMKLRAARRTIASALGRSGRVGSTGGAA